MRYRKVGQKGYTALHDSKTGIVRFHHDRKVENLNPRRYARNRPEFWSVIKRSLVGKSTGGYYDWLDTDGLTRKKYMYIVPVKQKTGDGVRLSVAAAADVDEFTQPVRKAELVHRNSARYVTETVHKLIGSFRQAGLLFMGLAILVVSLLASLVGRYFSRTITELSAATSRVNEGDFNVAVKPPMSGEVGTLVDDFNRMVARLAETTVSKQLLQASEDRLRKTNAELVREVAERARAEEALASEKERLDVTLRSIGEGVMTADREGTIVLINEMAEKLTGWSDEEARGQQLDHIYRTFDEATRDPGPNPIDTVLLENGPVMRAQPRLLIARDGTELSIADNGAPVRAPDGAILGVVIVFRDVTEQRRIGPTEDPKDRVPGHPRGWHCPRLQQPARGHPWQHRLREDAVESCRKGFCQAHRGRASVRAWRGAHRTAPRLCAGRGIGQERGPTRGCDSGRGVEGCAAVGYELRFHDRR